MITILESKNLIEKRDIDSIATVQVIRKYLLFDFLPIWRVKITRPVNRWTADRVSLPKDETHLLSQQKSE